ncbi:MAG: hypothetical protein U0992_08205 [Planctomycetaceae bacterium]
MSRPAVMPPDMVAAYLEIDEARAAIAVSGPEERRRLRKQRQAKPRTIHAFD